MDEDNNPKAGERKIEGFSYTYSPAGETIHGDFGMDQDQALAVMKNFIQKTEANNAPGKLVEALDKGLIHEWDLMFLCATGMNAIMEDMDRRLSDAMPEELKRALKAALAGV